MSRVGCRPRGPVLVPKPNPADDCGPRFYPTAGPRSTGPTVAAPVGQGLLVGRALFLRPVGVLVLNRLSRCDIFRLASMNSSAVEYVG